MRPASSRNWGTFLLLLFYFHQGATAFLLLQTANRRTVSHLLATTDSEQQQQLEKQEQQQSVSDSDKSKKDATTTTSMKRTWNPFRLAVLRLGLTEPAMTSPLNYGTYDGDFTCAYCGAVLFDTYAKYDSKSGWPSFWRTKHEGALAYQRDFGGGLECKCKQCNSHLGHVFLDGPTPTSVDKTVLESSPESDPRGSRNTNLPRFCINGAALRYQKNEETTT